MPRQEKFFSADAEKAGLPEDRKTQQKKLDEPLAKALAADMKAHVLTSL